MQKILIIEDDKFLGDVLLQKLSNEKFEVCLVADGSLAIDKIKSFQPDLILLDILLPTFNGYEILEEKQNIEDIKDIPVIILSNSGQPVEISRALNLGVKDYLVKAHFSPDEVLIKINQQLGPKKLQDIKFTTNSIKDKTIMWVEDDSFLSEIINRKMLKMKCNFIHISNGAEVLKKLEEVTPDLIMLDILLPEMSGLEVLEKIKSNPKTKDIKVILISNMSQSADIKKYKELGATEFLIKSNFSLDEIFEKMIKVLRED